MSYILEALKQSEKERKQEPTTEPQPIPVVVARQAPARRRGRLPGAVVVAVALGILVWWQWKAGLPSEPVVAQVAATPASQPAAPKAAGTVANGRPAAMVSSLGTDDLKGIRIQVEAPVPVRARSAAPSGTVRTDTAASARSDEPSQALAPQQDAKNDSGAATTAHADVPYWRQLPVDVQRRLPELRFSVHIYSKDPAARRVKVGEQMMREGQRISPQLRLEEIIPRGVILTYEDYRFRMNVL